MASFIVIVVATIIGMIVSSFVGYYVCQWRKKKFKAREECSSYEVCQEQSQHHGLELPVFSFEVINVATDKFSSGNKIGEGGFGPVYKGKLPNGQEIAVKRLSRSSGQGIEEFKNEVVLIAKLQHRNLVRLLGCCIQGGETMLVYEFLPNKSLDNFIFDDTKRKLLPWKNRFHIITGIARGLLYLHEDSRLRIIHRDLKASNILIDNDLHPKISDFGIARIFGGEQMEGLTKNVMGTYGYMSPEYAMSGHFSVKSDVFSFGVLVLEIISGKRNWRFSHPEHDLNLGGHAWKLWNERSPLELMDQVLEDSFCRNEVIRCILVGLLCIQPRMQERPTMSQVVFMLSNETAELPEPKDPGLWVESFSVKVESSSSGLTTASANEVTITMLAGR